MRLYNRYGHVCFLELIRLDEMIKIQLAKWKLAGVKQCGTPSYVRL